MKQINLKIKKQFDRLRKKTLIIGLTGQIGSGKSEALKYFSSRSFFTVSTDILAAETLTSKPCYSKLIKRFGPGILNKDGSVNKRALSEIVFRDKRELKWLERLIHPAVNRETINLIKKSNEKTVIIDVPLLFESGFNVFCDLTISIHADEKIRLARILKRNWSRKNAERRMKNQFSSGKKSELSDITVLNNSSLKIFFKKLEDICKIIKR